MENESLASSLTSLLTLITFASFTTTFLHLCHSQNDPSQYDLCKPFRCGNTTFSFPFYSASGPLFCGLPHYQITSCDSSSLAELELAAGRLYQVKDIFPSDNFITLIDNELIRSLNSGLCGSLKNLIIPKYDADIAPLGLPPWNFNLTFFTCPRALALSQYSVHGLLNCSEGTRLYLSSVNESDYDSPRQRQPETPAGCELVTVPVSRGSLSRYKFFNASFVDPNTVLFVLRDGFTLEWPALPECENCTERGGRCGYDGSARKALCFCRGGGCEIIKHNQPNRWKLIVGVTIGSICVLLALALFLIFKYKNKLSHNFRTAYFTRKETTEDGRNAKQFMKNFQSNLLNNYSYNDIRRMTNGFNHKLGKGGYGSVYKGELLDGRAVAVKVLDKSSDFGDNFINEVTTIGLIHHVNVIRLLGFCWDGLQQALIYDYMPNGSLADWLSKEGPNHALGLARLLEIAMGVAYGIEYLHSGCDSRILHLDIKPQNVLLDENFNPKVSDFGLAKIYSRNRSVITISGTRGTIGYIAPEIFLRNIGNPSHKSDVYSYGMLLLEITGGKKYVAPKVSSSNEAYYFPGWIYDKLIEEEKMEFVESVVEEEAYIAKKMIMVGLWCIQVNPTDRPSMTKVVEMLRGSVEAIEMPPKPVFFSPPHEQFEQVSNAIDDDTSALSLTYESYTP